ncbi:hypothetical protein WICMUC_004303 [Wickerhamomyces mucosus]|uniref:NADP-dependent oxidoreductase domain-containing protein n=1 Tax=Wickerhamomyces mucosus TaxID=1378264 RepID=A0A9P8PHS9_9ASCO|nr:hypothetical protein WICMUC_004303 [Wickerhamomyces mucosus]
MTLSNITKTLTLNTGAKIPQVGFGTYQSNPQSNEGYNAVLAALKAGYRHIDAAAAYRNENEVGKAIRDSGIPREEIFVTTKLWQTQHRDPSKALDESLERLGLEYVDLYLIHWPSPQIARDNSEDALFEFLQKPNLDTEWNINKTWELVQELPATGKAKAVGVSNFSIKQLKQIIESPSTKIIPAANQIEIHPLFPNTELIEFSKSHSIIIEAYSPLGSQIPLKGVNPLFSNTTLQSLAESKNVSIAQLLVNWGVKRGYVVLPKSSKPERIEQNLKDIDLTDDDFERISNLLIEIGENRMIDVGWNDFSNY